MAYMSEDKDKPKYDWMELGKTYGITFNDKSKGMYEYYKEKYTKDKDFKKQWGQYVKGLKKEVETRHDKKGKAEKPKAGASVKKDVSDFAKNLLSKLEAQLATATTSEEKSKINAKIAKLKSKYGL